jgi:hypothetical protein
MKSNACPLCKMEGEFISISKVENLVKRYFRKHMKSSEYGFCANPNCSVAYFNNDKDEIYFQRDLTDD